MNTKIIRLLLVGCGRIGQRHADIIFSNAQLVGVCDIDLLKAEIFSKKYNTPAFTSLQNMVNSVDADALVICTPNGLHAAHSITGLKAGLHILCEKPMAISLEDAQQMIEQAKQNNRLLHIVKQNRYNPPVVALKKILEERHMGEIFSMQLSCLWNREAAYYKNSWRGSLEMDGGTLYTQFSHFIDIVYWMFGDIKEVKAICKNSANKGEAAFDDNGVVLLEFENGIIGSIHYSVNAYKKNREGSLTVIGEKGVVKIGGQYLNEMEYCDIENFELPQITASNLSNNYGHYEGSMSNHEEVYQSFLNSITHYPEYASNMYESIKTVELIQRIHQSGRK